MASAASTLSSFKPDSKSTSKVRNTANFHPSIWKDYFLQYASESKELDHKTVAQVETLKKEVRKMITSASRSENLIAKIVLIDAICRLGLQYHFVHEIEDIMQLIHNNFVKNGEIIMTHLQDNLRSTALLFRLLRQHGFRVSPDVFNKFKDKHGSFSKKLAADVEGMLSLYEASYLMVHGEDILEEALEFTRTHLESIATQLNPFLASQVNHSLRQPLHKGLPRLEARHYISIYQQDPTHDETLLTLAKLDFNLLQKLHQREVGNITRWWKELDVASKLPYARDRVVEGCYWILGLYFEPQYSQARQLMSKVIALLTIIDDTYDAYGTIDELELFTKAFQRWDMSCLDYLPEYMKLPFRTTLKVYDEADQEMKEEGRAGCINYVIKEFKRFIESYMSEARWCNNIVPTTDEYTRVSLASGGISILIATSYIRMGPTATEDIFKWLTSHPKILTASEIIGRFLNDIVSNEFEQKRDHVTSMLECYMRDYKMSREEAVIELRKKVRDAWKDTNEECLRPTKVPMPFLMRILNISRFSEVIYKDQDNYTHSEGSTKKNIEALLVDPVPI